MAATNSSTPSQEYLLECFDYNQDTGVLRWKVRPREHFATEHGWKISNSQCACHVVGAISDQGYLLVGINYRIYRVHRIIWMMAYGRFTELHIDHINGNRTDNRLANLREATEAENHRNCRISRNNKSGFKGISFHKRSGKYQAAIRTDGARTHLGYFSTPQEAHAAYCAAADKYHGQFANHGDKP